MPPPASTYTFNLKKFSISDTRSFHNDTNVVGFAVKAGNRMYGPVIAHTGDVNNGDHLYNVPGQGKGELFIHGVRVRDDEVVTVQYQFYNNGHGGRPTDDELRQALIQSAPDLVVDPNTGGIVLASGDGSPSGNPDPHPGLGFGAALKSFDWQAIFNFSLGPLAFLFGSCDGPVAIYKYSVTGLKLRLSHTTTGQIGRRDEFKGGELGYGKPCNSSGSHYTITWAAIL